MDKMKGAYNNCQRNNVDDALIDKERNDILREKSKKVKSLINKSKKAMLVKDLNDATTSREKWNVIKGLGVTKDKSNNDSEVLNNFNLDEFNNFFASIHKSNGVDLNDLSLSTNINSTFSFQEVDDEQILNAFNKIKSNAIGDDEIPLKFLKLVMPIRISTNQYHFSHPKNFRDFT